MAKYALAGSFVYSLAIATHFVTGYHTSLREIDAAAQGLTFDTSSPRQCRYGGDNFVGIDWFCNMHLKASK
jgi:hypothetical protein